MKKQFFQLIIINNMMKKQRVALKKEDKPEATLMKKVFLQILKKIKNI
jgi:hypothetical protein